MDNNVMFEMADRLKTLKEEKKQKELELRNISDMLTEIEAALAEFMTLNETPNFTHGGTSFSLRTSLKASAVSGKKEELYSSLKNAGYGDLVSKPLIQARSQHLSKSKLQRTKMTSRMAKWSYKHI